MSESSDDTHAHADSESESESEDVQTLRREVEEKYDFENFGPADMAEMAPEEWEAAFDADTWITGEELLGRVEDELRSRVADREVFARIERFDDVLVAYSDSGYAAVYQDGSVEGRGTVLRDVKPTVALCSMDSYEVADPPPGGENLPEPDEVTESSDALGNTVLQVVGAVQVVAGLVLLGAALFSLTGLYRAPGIAAGGANLVIVLLAGIGFLLIGVFLFVTVANARLSDRFRAEEYRDRLRAVGLADGERPAFLAEIDGVALDRIEEAEPLEGGAGGESPGSARDVARSGGEVAEGGVSADSDGEPGADGQPSDADADPVDEDG